MSVMLAAGTPAVNAYATTTDAAAVTTDIYSQPGDPSVVVSNATANWPQASDITSEAGIIMDADTGAILYSKNMDQQMYPASVTKIMTCLLALEHGNLDDQVTMTATGTAYAVSGSANLYTQVGEVFTLRDMLYGIMLASANDMSTQVAEYIGGSVEQFVAMMNEKAASLGCTNTHFNNACGMPDEQHWTSAHDLALIGQEALKNDIFREIVHTKAYTIPATNMTAARTFGNHHPFLTNPDYPYDGIIGGKTGYIDASGNTLETFAERDGMTLICVTLKANGMDPELKDHKAILDYGFDNFTHLQVESDDSNEVTDGGLLTVPTGTELSSLTTETGEDGETNYYYSGVYVGSASLEAVSDEAASDATVSGDDRASDGQSSDLSSADAQADTSSWLSGIISMFKQNQALTIIGALSLLILICIIAIIVTLIRRRGRRK